MSCKMDTDVSLCFNTAAGCISRQQLVQFHNWMGPRAQRGLRCTVWQKKCHNSSFSNCLVSYWKPAVFFSSERMQNRGRAHPFENTDRLLTVHFSRQAPQWGKSRHPNRSCWEAAPTRPWAKLSAALQCVRSHGGQYSPPVYSSALYQKHCI